VVRYSPSAAQALAYLKRPYNDIDIFVEDTAGHNMWLVLLRRVLPKRVRLTSVNQLGGRANVLKACKLAQNGIKRKQLYIIDADFDYLLNKRKPKLKHLYRIRAYCIENLLMREAALVQVGLSAMSNATEAQIASSLQFGRWYGTVSKQLAPLFCTYAVAHQLAPQHHTVSFAVGKLLTHQRGKAELDSLKVIRRCREIARLVVKAVGYQPFLDTMNIMRARSARLSPVQTISGKDYLFPILHIWLRRQIACRGTIEELKVRLAEFWDASSEPWLTRTLNHI